MKSNTLILCLVFVICIGCSTEDKYQTAAKEICNCMRPMKELSDKITELSAEGKTEEIQELVADFQEKMVTANTCAEELDEKYALEGEEKTKVLNAIKEKCPDISTMMNSF